MAGSEPMKNIAKLIALPAVLLCLVTSTVPALAAWGDRERAYTEVQPNSQDIVQPYSHNAVQPYRQFGTGRGAALGALGGYAMGKLTHNPHPIRNSLIGAGVGAYLGHRRH